MLKTNTFGAGDECIWAGDEHFSAGDERIENACLSIIHTQLASQLVSSNFQPEFILTWLLVTAILSSENGNHPSCWGDPKVSTFSVALNWSWSQENKENYSCCSLYTTHKFSSLGVARPYVPRLDHVKRIPRSRPPRMWTVSEDSFMASFPVMLDGTERKKMDKIKIFAFGFLDLVNG